MSPLSLYETCSCGNILSLPLDKKVLDHSHQKHAVTFIPKGV